MKRSSATRSHPACEAAFIVGLQRTAQQRGIPTQQAWQAAGFDIRWWEGVDGAQKLTLKRGEKALAFFLRALNARLQSDTLFSGCAMLGCYLSHYRLWQHCLSKGYQRVLIVEDDATPMPLITEMWDTIQTLDDSFELIKLHHLLCPQYLKEPHSQASYALRHLIGNKGHGNVELHRLFNRTYGTSAYLATRAALHKLVKHAMPVRMPVDIYMDRFEIHDTKVYMTLGDPLVKNTLPSTIQNLPPLPRAKHVKKNLWMRTYHKLSRKCTRDFLNFRKAWIVFKSPRGSFHPDKRIPPYLKGYLKKTVKEFFQASS